MRTVFVLEITTDCPRNCSYCFARKTKERMECLDEVIDFLKEQNDIVVVFFGGEPLLERESINYIIEKLGKKKYILCSGVPKGYEAELEELSKNCILYLSYNGIYNDEMREGKSMDFDFIVDVIQKGRKISSYRLNFPPNYNKEKYIESVLPLIVETKDMIYFSLGIDKMSIINKDVKYAEDYFWVLENLCEKIKNFNPVHKVGICCSRSARTGQAGFNMCGSGSNFLYIDVKGNIYPCFMDRWENGIKLGNIREGFIRLPITEIENKCNGLGFHYCRCPWTRKRLSRGISRYMPNEFLCWFTQNVNKILERYQEIIIGFVPKIRGEKIKCL